MSIDQKRLELIKKTVDKVNKTFKDDVAQTLSDAFQPEKVKLFVPTGNMALDFVIGRAGFPVGRISEISGPFSSGKCLTGDSLITMADGSMRKIIEVEKGDKVYCPYITDPDNNEHSIVNTVKDLLHQGKQEVYKITLNNGLTLKATKNHPFLGIKSGVHYNNVSDLPFYNEWPWKKLEELSVNDYIAGGSYKALTDKLSGNTTIVSALATFLKYASQSDVDFVKHLSQYSDTTVEAAILVYFFKENSCKFIKYGDNFQLSLTSKNYHFIHQLYVYLVSLHYYSTQFVDYDNKSFGVRIKNKDIIYVLLNSFFMYAFSFFEKERLAEYEQYLENFKADSSTYSYRSVPYSFLRIIKMFLRDRKEQYALDFIEEYEKDDLRKDSSDFANKIIPETIIQVLETSTYYQDTSVPYHPTIVNLVSNLEWFKIKSIEPVGIEETYDLSMEGRPYFVANGIIAHNSTICAMAIANAQKAGMVTILLDTEHSYDSTWASKYGVDPDLLILTEPEHVEQIFDLVRVYMSVLAEDNTGIPIFCVVDSISATAASAELESEDSTAGKQRALHAKLLSEGLRKIGKEIWHRNLALVFISQLKDNPGMLYGAGQHKLGGEAINFHAGLLIKTGKASVLKQNDAVVGLKVKVTATKNKFVPPFRHSHFDINYLTGVDNRAIALEFMADIGQIRKTRGGYELAGAFYRKADLLETITPQKIIELYDYLGLTNPTPETVTNGNNIMYLKTTKKKEEVEDSDA